MKLRQREQLQTGLNAWQQKPELVQNTPHNDEGQTGMFQLNTSTIIHIDHSGHFTLWHNDETFQITQDCPKNQFNILNWIYHGNHHHFPVGEVRDLNEMFICFNRIFCNITLLDILVHSHVFKWNRSLFSPNFLFIFFADNNHKDSLNDKVVYY